MEQIEAVPKLTASSAVQKQETECENSFWRLCRQADCDKPELGSLYADYITDICKTLWSVYDETLSSLRLRAHALAAAEEGRKGLYFEIQKLKKEAGI